MGAVAFNPCSSLMVRSRTARPTTATDPALSMPNTTVRSSVSRMWASHRIWGHKSPKRTVAPLLRAARILAWAMPAAQVGIQSQLCGFFTDDFGFDIAKQLHDLGVMPGHDESKLGTFAGGHRHGQIGYAKSAISVLRRAYPSFSNSGVACESRGRVGSWMAEPGTKCQLASLQRPSRLARSTALWRPERPAPPTGRLRYQRWMAPNSGLPLDESGFRRPSVRHRARSRGG